mmetsp:Transcript_2858/g.4611  ORF Transcript_2858/g.4611 Transcript_2858/m.4611 type:complete len:323 (+) Transcript_2858:298-1266(+)|eukprot:CAMPEP_0119015434 /NCGR_PEP_ID=MMETSP1176-20130426/11005_1 /TAXON_ID=265551 /ORGANISM="Synedropsis recta cf, Strain CCMP1620" /LENGTH=322 /DNA_ID=CAMNT_0006968725 /DNA_START=224 /DNA_END=1192 /DNA_ORIENTATION=+
MEDVKKFTLIWVLCLIFTVATVITFVALTRKLTIEFCHPDSWKLKKHWWRFVLPSVITVILASFSADVSMNIFGHAAWIAVCGIFVPFWLTWNSLNTVMAKKWDRVMAVVTLLLLLNACFLTVGWAFARRTQFNNYMGKANIIDWFSSGQSSQELLKVELEWACWSDEDESTYYCQDNQVIDCGEITRKELYTTRDYDMTIYNQNSFIDCQNGFDIDIWKEYGWANNKWSDDDGANDENQEENGGNDDQYSIRPSMKIIGDCSTCEIDSHSEGNMYKAKRNWLIIPLWVVTSLAAVLAGYLWSTRPEEKAASEKLVHEPEFA